LLAEEKREKGEILTYYFHGPGPIYGFLYFVEDVKLMLIKINF
jgi:hypothetical protein